ncbi:MAG TPA: ComEC/Rec2 family competence protein, partial [Spirochaetota bacterium]|nr:ComEC/Rec2 family competence protein [Spirochaetota bacterium]
LSVFKTSLSQDSFGFFSSIFFGSKTELDETVLQEFRDSGLIHLLAISGLHIGFIGAIFLKFFSIFLSKTKSYILSVTFLYLYVLLLPSQPSALRAALMYSITASFFVMGNRTLSVTILSFSAIILLFINPYCIYNLGFQFSYLATLGIILFNKDLGRFLPNILPGKIKDSISVTFCAFAAVFFLQWAIFGRAPLFSLITSIVFVPLFELLFSSLFITTIVFLIFRIEFMVAIMDKMIILFLKAVSLAGKVSPVNLPDIPLYLGYIGIPIILFVFYALFPYIKKKVKYFIIR